MLAWPLVEVGIAPQSASDADALEAALSRLAASDAHFKFARDKESGLFLLGGSSEAQLDENITRLRDDAPPFNVGALQIAYREHLQRAVRIDCVHKRITGPKGEFARVVIDFEPARAGTDFTFENKASLAVPAEFVPSIEKGLQIARANGVIAGFPLVDFTATLVDGAYHDIDSSPRAFQIAAQCAVRELKGKGEVRIAEPVMNIQVTAPESIISVIASDLNARCGVIQDRRVSGGTVTLSAVAPFANMLGYVHTLNAISQGRAVHTMQFAEYRPVPLPDGDPPFPPAVGMRA